MMLTPLSWPITDAELIQQLRVAAGHDEQRLGVRGPPIRLTDARRGGCPARPSAPASPSASTASPQTPQVTRSHGWVQSWSGSATPGLPRAAPSGLTPRPPRPDRPPQASSHMPARAAGTPHGWRECRDRPGRVSRFHRYCACPRAQPSSAAGQGTGMPRRVSSASRWRGASRRASLGHGPEDLELDPVRVLRIERQANAVVRRARPAPRPRSGAAGRARGR